MLSDKFIEKYMLMAQTIGTVHNPCYSRQIGVVIVRDNKILGTGYNGPPAGTPHCDDYDYLTNFFWPQLTEREKTALVPAYNANKDVEACISFADSNADCRTCPRRLIYAGPGERSTLCSCQHAERNAITNAADDLTGASMFCWCGVPCIDCTGAIINAGIRDLYYLDDGKPVYHSVSPYLFEQAGINLYNWNPETKLVSFHEASEW